MDHDCSIGVVATDNKISQLGAISHFINIEKGAFGVYPLCLKNFFSKIWIYKNGFLITKAISRRIKANFPMHFLLV